MGHSDRFIGVVLPEELDPENYEDIRLSDGFADIYQDLKDFVNSYEIGNDNALTAALYECVTNYEKFWGQRLLAILCYLHNFLYHSELYEEDEYRPTSPNEQEDNNTNWPINQRFEE